MVDGGYRGDSTLYRVPPHNFEAEMALLGAILFSNAAYDKVAGFLRPEHFAGEQHAKIFEAIQHLRARGKAADPVSIKDVFDATGELESVGGVSYLARLAASVVSVVNAEDYGWTIWDRWVRRQTIALGQSLIEDAYAVTLDSTAERSVAKAIGDLSNLLGSASASRLMTIAECAALALQAADAAAKTEGGITGVPTGLSALDNLLGGLKRGRLIIGAARPGMGKSTAAVNFAATAASRGYRVAFFQLEMMSEEMGAMAISCMTQIASSSLLRGRFSMEQFGLARDAQAMMADWPLFVDSTPKITVAEMVARARTIKPDLVVFDHLLLSGGAQPGQTDLRKVELTGAVTGALKVAAKQLDAAVLALCQLKRPEQGKEDRRPVLEDLKWAGEIEQDADDVFFLYRPHYYLGRVPEKSRDFEWKKAWTETMNVTEIIVGKNRGGPGANHTVKVNYDPATGTFSDLPEAASAHETPQGEFNMTVG